MLHIYILCVGDAQYIASLNSHTVRVGEKIKKIKSPSNGTRVVLVLPYNVPHSLFCASGSEKSHYFVISPLARLF